MVVSIILIVSLLASVAVSNTMVKKSAKEKFRLNPAPFDKIKAPISSSGLNMLDNKEQFIPEVMENIVQKEIGSPALAAIRFNLENGNLHQNEESVGYYGQYVLSGANDYRGLFGKLGGMSGYYVSKDSGTSTWREGALPKLSGVESGTGQKFTAYSGGDPVIDVYKATGDFYYGSLYFDDKTNTWALGLAKSTPAKLADKTLTDAQVWQVTNVRADDSSVQANDKEWIAVDNTAGLYKGKIYVTWTAFNAAGNGRIWMARCKPSPFSCSTIHNNANAVSGAQIDTQMSKVSIDSAGRVIVTWLEYINSATAPYYKVRLWYRVFAPGGATPITAPRLIGTLDKPVSFYYALQGNEMRVPAGLWNEVTTVAGKTRMYTAYFKCNGAYLYDDMVSYADACSNADSYLKYVTGYETSAPKMSSEIGLETSPTAHSFWPTLSINPKSGKLDIAWYQTESVQKHDYSVAYQQRSLSTPTTITSPTSLIYAGDPDSEVYFGSIGAKTYGYVNGIFIGDYFQIVTKPGTPNRVYIGYNGNTRYASPITYTNSLFGTFKMGGNQMDNILYTKTY